MTCFDYFKAKRKTNIQNNLLLVEMAGLFQSNYYFPQCWLRILLCCVTSRVIAVSLVFEMLIVNSAIQAAC